jgi:hypothetical protein
MRLIVLFDVRLRSKSGGGLKLKSTHVTRPNVADTSVFQALRPLGSYCIGAAIRAKMKWLFVRAIDA